MEKGHRFLVRHPRVWPALCRPTVEEGMQILPEEGNCGRGPSQDGSLGTGTVVEEVEYFSWPCTPKPGWP